MKIHRVFSGRGAKPNLELSIGGQSKTGTWRTRKRSCSSYFSKDTGAVEAAFVFRESESCMLFGGASMKLSRQWLIAIIGAENEYRKVYQRPMRRINLCAEQWWHKGSQVFTASFLEMWREIASAISTYDRGLTKRRKIVNEPCLCHVWLDAVATAERMQEQLMFIIIGFEFRG